MYERRPKEHRSDPIDPNGSLDDCNLTYWQFIEIPSYEEVKEDTKKFNEAFRIIYENQDPFQGKTIAQKHGNRFVIQYPPPLPYSPLRA